MGKQQIRRATEYERGCENVYDLITNALEQWVADALLLPEKYTNHYERKKAIQIKAEAIADFEKAKLDPEGCPLLNRAVFVLNIMYDRGKTNARATEADILDKLLGRSGLPWDIQPSGEPASPESKKVEATAVPKAADALAA